MDYYKRLAKAMHGLKYEDLQKLMRYAKALHGNDTETIMNLRKETGFNPGMIQ